jgi:hypothetical protein
MNGALPGFAAEPHQRRRLCWGSGRGTGQAGQSRLERGGTSRLPIAMPSWTIPRSSRNGPRRSFATPGGACPRRATPAPAGRRHSMRRTPSRGDARVGGTGRVARHAQTVRLAGCGRVRTRPLVGSVCRTAYPRQANLGRSSRRPAGQPQRQGHHSRLTIHHDRRPHRAEADVPGSACDSGYRTYNLSQASLSCRSAPALDLALRSTIAFSQVS